MNGTLDARRWSWRSPQKSKYKTVSCVTQFGTTSAVTDAIQVKKELDTLNLLESTNSWLVAIIKFRKKEKKIHEALVSALFDQHNFPSSKRRKLLSFPTERLDGGFANECRTRPSARLGEDCVFVIRALHV
jgi:hypothetical protein